jgi:hypothetical protein
MFCIPDIPWDNIKNCTDCIPEIVFFTIFYIMMAFSRGGEELVSTPQFLKTNAVPQFLEFHNLLLQSASLTQERL